jgi:FAD:protein FMN transferase
MKAALPILFSILLTSCSLGNIAGTADKPVESDNYMMGTTIMQKVYGADAQKAVDETSKRIKEIEGLMTINAPGGDINRLNEAAGKGEVVLNSETLAILETAKRYAALSGGSFDVTVGPLVKAWGVFTDHPRIPPQDEIDRLLKLVDYRTLTIDIAKSSARLEKPGQIVDLGGIAKGYAGDEAIKIYKRHNIKSAYINLGGNVVVLGNKPDGGPWRIGIQNPRAANGLYIGVVKVTDKSVVTSGDYERYFEKDNIRYHHILDTKTGYPADSGLISSTIITDVSMDADALSTATFVLGLDKGMKLVNSLKGVEAVFITKDKKVYVTEGLKSSFTFDDESKEFEYVEKG